jgi:hypothetical protein
MPTLASDLRNKLERVVIEARESAEVGARDALEALAIHHHDPYTHMQPAQRELRNHLRARARQLGDRKLPKADGKGKDHEIDHLVGECAYEHWHRMLFARFLAENSLLIEPHGNQAISLGEAEELAKEDGVNVWVFTSRCAQRMLPQIFRPEDPLLKVSFAPEHMLKLEKLLASMPQALFAASDALGWVYQFWQSKKKDEVNRSEVKIGADEISAVTQLFTEPYMVEFLLHNTLGAWWAGKKLGSEDAGAKTENELRRKLALPGIDWEYLRFIRGADGVNGPWRPAAGTFDGWPKTARDIKFLDPCCGSGHFLVAALHHLVPIRMAEESLSAAQAVDAVLRDNLHGLEIDERCCQIAAFALAFAAWTYPEAGGYRPLPNLRIACTGIGPQATKTQWLELAEKAAVKGNMPAKRDLFRIEESLLSSTIANALESLYDLFVQAPTLGSLIDPRRLSKDLYRAGYDEIAPLLGEVFKAETDDETRERAIAASGMAKAADLLAGQYTLVITNPPYLGFQTQSATLSDFTKRVYPRAKADLATCFVERCLELCGAYATVALVTPQNWLFLSRFKHLRKHLLSSCAWQVVARLGERSFSSPQAAGAFTAMVVISQVPIDSNSMLVGLDVAAEKDPERKAIALLRNAPVLSKQTESLHRSDSTVTFTPLSSLPLLSSYADSLTGAHTLDIERFRLFFWELNQVTTKWNLHASSPEAHSIFSGMSYVSYTREEGEAFSELAAAMKEEGFLGGWLSGRKAWGNVGVAVSWMRQLPASLYLGAVYDNSVAVVLPHRIDLLPAIWCFCSSPDYSAEVRKINQKVQVANATLVKVPFDLAYWQKVGADKYPDGLPEPESDDPTQWLFPGWPEKSTAPLQVAVARLLGYRWPAELDEKMRVSKQARALVKRCDDLVTYTDNDGVICVPSVRGEEPAAERLLALLTAAGIKPAKVLEAGGASDLDDWLRNSFFEEHCRLFHDRPFVWHIWDGRKSDGFHALVNYHKLSQSGGKGRKLLESLSYSYLGDWVTRQKDGVKRGEGGAEGRLVAALELQKRLEALLAGEPPFDLFVRWKPLAEQPIGWEPDVNDGVRINIRPFIASDLPAGRTGAGVLRWKPSIKWTKDRGKEPKRPKAEYPWFWGWDEKTEDFVGGSKFDGNRHNDCHYTNKAKQAARDAAKSLKRG